MDITENEFIKMLKESFGEDDASKLPEIINMEENLENLSGWDSLTRLVLTTIIEEEYNVELEQADFKHLETVRELYEAIKAKA